MNEYQPATPTQRILVGEMAQAHWLSQRGTDAADTVYKSLGPEGAQTMARTLVNAQAADARRQAA